MTEDSPLILMPRFALDLSEQGKGYGKVLFRDALRRALAGAEAIGGRAFLVHAKDEEARAFYALCFAKTPSGLYFQSFPQAARRS